jgi:glutamate formiminotransferase/formiminotetrahydrofolate cyclodeaminase
MQLLECVPNFSEGNDIRIINQLVETIASVDNVKVLHVDMGKTVNRTVITFVGEPDAVVEAAFQVVKCASELIDMRLHKGSHPRIGATDVLPLVPISGITIEETIELAHKLAKRIGDELQIPIYCYEQAALIPERKKLEYCRKGEYEVLKKLSEHDWKPDFGPAQFNAKAGLTIVGVRDFLIAFNVNLNTTSKQIAVNIAEEIRESGKMLQINGIKTKVPGKLKNVKAIGWNIDEYKCAQVSTNITNFRETPVHVVFEEIKIIAKKYNTEVAGSEFIGLVPLDVFIHAGLFLTNNPKLSENELVTTAIQYFNPSQFAPFIANQRIIEYLLD